MELSKSVGPDDAYPATIKFLADLLTGPICNLLKTTLQQEHLPENWKTAAAVTVHMSHGRK